MKIAVVGSGISGLAVAYKLAGKADVTLFEANAYFGGHTHTVDVSLPDHTGEVVAHGVDTGFLVLNQRTYPKLIALLKDLDVPTALSDMSFSVQASVAGSAVGIEWAGSSLNSLFAQRRNLFRPAFWQLLREILRFNALCTRLAESGLNTPEPQSLRQFLQKHRFAPEFQQWYLLPMLGCIWSCPLDQMLEFPVATMVRFCHNHGLLQISNRPQWLTVQGGARNYVEKIVGRVKDKRLNTPVRSIGRNPGSVSVVTDHYTEQFDQVVLATHSDQSLRLLQHPSGAEQALLGAIRYQPNRAVLHTDANQMPARQRAWAAWNYESSSTAGGQNRVCLHYWLNLLQPLPFAKAHQTPVLVSLNPVRPIDPSKILAEFDYAHPVFDLAALRAQQRLPALQGQGGVWYAGAWMGYGFHEDGLKAGLAVAEDLLQTQKRPAGPPTEPNACHPVATT